MKAEFEWSEGGSIEIQDGVWRSVSGKLLLAADVEDDAGVDALIQKVQSIVRETVQGEYARLWALRQGGAPAHTNPPPDPWEDEYVAPPAVSAAPVAESAVAESAEFAEEVGETISFKVESFEFGESSTGIPLAKVRGGYYKKYGVTAWEEIVEMVFGDPETWDRGAVLPPPYPMRAICETKVNDKGKTTPTKVIELERIG